MPTNYDLAKDCILEKISSYRKTLQYFALEVGVTRVISEHGEAEFSNIRVTALLQYRIQSVIDTLFDHPSQHHRSTVTIE